MITIVCLSFIDKLIESNPLIYKTVKSRENFLPAAFLQDNLTPFSTMHILSMYTLSPCLVDNPLILIPF